jgi:hypothetical protein
VPRNATSDEAPACAKTLAGLFGASLHVVHAGIGVL